jgi:hypothetical protein
MLRRNTGLIGFSADLIIYFDRRDFQGSAGLDHLALPISQS